MITIEEIKKNAIARLWFEMTGCGVDDIHVIKIKHKVPQDAPELASRFELNENVEYLYFPKVSTSVYGVVGGFIFDMSLPKIDLDITFCRKGQVIFVRNVNTHRKFSTEKICTLSERLEELQYG